MKRREFITLLRTERSFRIDSGQFRLGLRTCRLLCGKLSLRQWSGEGGLIMRPLSKGTMRNAVPTVLLGAWIALGTPALVRANVITDWDEKGVAFVTSNIVGPGGTRAMAMVHVAMFDAVNSIERRYRPYLVQLPVDASTSKEAAAAAAAGAVLAGLVPVNSKAWEEMKAATANYLATLPDG